MTCLNQWLFVDSRYEMQIQSFVRNKVKICHSFSVKFIVIYIIYHMFISCNLDRKSFLKGWFLRILKIRI